MPTENEYKFVLKMNTEQKIEFDGSILRIDQGYLTDDGSLRLRYQSESDTSNHGRKQKFFMTYKSMSANKDRLVEIETEISERDWQDISHKQRNRFVKSRYIPNSHPNWVIDFFINNNKTYFVMAEVELPEGETVKNLPSFITENLLYEVAKFDERFSSSKLHDKQYAERLLEEINYGQISC